MMANNLSPSVPYSVTPVARGPSSSDGEETSSDTDSTSSPVQQPEQVLATTTVPSSAEVSTEQPPATTTSATYQPLLGSGVPWIEFPQRVSASAAAAVARTPSARGRSLASETLPPGKVGVFVGQLPFNVTAHQLAFVVDYILGREATHMASIAHRQACGWLCVDTADAEKLFGLSDTVLMETAGMWHATTPAEAARLHDFCTQLRARRFGNAMLKLHLPKAPVTFRPTVTPGPKPSPQQRSSDASKVSRAATADAPQAMPPQPQQNPAGVPATAPPMLPTSTTAAPLYHQHPSGTMATPMAMPPGYPAATMPYGFPPPPQGLLPTPYGMPPAGVPLAPPPPTGFPAMYPGAMMPPVPPMVPPLATPPPGMAPFPYGAPMPMPPAPGGIGFPGAMPGAPGAAPFGATAMPR